MALSRSQLGVIERLSASGASGVLARWPGGFWAPPETPWEWHKSLGHEPHMAPKWYTAVQTVRSLERLGLLTRSNRHPEAWRDDRELVAVERAEDAPLKARIKALVGKK
jgi:hypothetical protein